MTLNISTDAEKKLRERASAEGKEPSAYAAEIVEHALSDSSRRPPELSEKEMAGLQASLEQSLQKARDMDGTRSLARTTREASAKSIGRSRYFCIKPRRRGSNGPVSV